MKEVKVASLIALSHLSKLVVNLFIMKQIAVRYGPDGLGFFGNFMSLIALASALAGGGIISGVIKYVSQYSGDAKRQSDFLTSAFTYTVASAITVLLIGLFLINTIADYVFLSSEFKGFIYFFLGVQLFIAINNFVFGVCNGLRKTEVYSLFVIVGNLSALVLSTYAISGYGYWGAIISIASPAFMSFIPMIIYIAVNKIPLGRYLHFRSLGKDSLLLSKYSLMLVCSSICFPLVEMIIRNMIIHSINLSTAGYWQAITRLSSAYLSFYSLFLSFYFVPLISAATDKQFIVTQVRKMIFFVLMLFTPMLVLFLILKHQVIRYIFSADFLPVADLFVVQMIGDLFRVLGWIIGFITVAKALSRLYILSEIIQASLFISLSYIQLMYTPELKGVVFAYVTTCIVYCMLSFGVFYYIFCSKKENWVRINNI